MNIREARENDLEQLLALHAQLHNMAAPQPVDDGVRKVWGDILADKNHHIVVGEIDGMLVASCGVEIILNLTHNQQSYALIENVVTHSAHRRKGYATWVLHFAKELALRNRCYKIMLMTGSKKESTLRFYENAGFNRRDKTAFIQWLE